MKRKIAMSLVLLIAMLMCCACGIKTENENNYNNPYSDYNQYDQYEFDITYKKDKDDISPAVYITKHGEKYHTPYCHHSQNAYMKLTVKQAVERGYTPCLICCY